MQLQNPLSIVYRETASLVPYARNSRTHDQAQVAQIAGSIREFGFTNPVLIDEQGGIIAGHGRVLAALTLDMVEVPTITLAGLTEAQKRAYVIADNKLALNAGWDEDLLRIELQELAEFDFDLGFTGFNEDEIEKLLGDEVKEGLTDEDAAPALPDEPATQPGDLWILGEHRLLCGDSTSFDALDSLMRGERAQMVFTDPPYGVDYKSNWSAFDRLQNDDTLVDFIPAVEAYSTGWVFIWSTWRVLDQWLAHTASLGFPTNIVIWHKGQGGMGDLKKSFSTDYEIALVYNRGAALCGQRIGSVWTIKKDHAGSYQHPTQKPVALAVEALDKTTKKDWIVLDLFGGSGSTLIACEKMGRKARLVELDPRYCDVIIKRWQEFTGLQAVLEADGRTFAEVSSCQRGEESQRLPA